MKEGPSTQPSPPVAFGVANCSLGVTSKQHPFPAVPSSSTLPVGVLQASLL